MSFGISVRNGLSIGLLASTFLTSGSARLIPRLTLNFLTGAPLDSRITFTRSTTATFYGSNGLLQVAAIDAPRFDYNPLTLAPNGLLIEEQRTNLALYSEQFDDLAWTKSATTITANATTSPDGTANADKIIPDTNNAEHYARQLIVIPAASSITASVYVKTAGYLSLRFRLLDLYNVANGFFGSVDTSTGATEIGATGAGTATRISATNVGNNWWRLSVTGTAGATATTIIFDAFVLSGNQSSATIFTGDGVSGLFIWGMQFEIGAFGTSYIPTVASPVARTADIAVMTGTNFSSWYNASEGTFVSSFGASPNTFTTYIAASNGVVAQNSMHMDNDGSGNMRVAYYSGSSAVALLSLGAVGTLGAVNTLATAYKVNDFAASRNGGAVVTDTLGAVPAGVTQLNIGADPSGAAVNVSNTHIRSITYYRSRLTNAQLQTISA